MTLPPNKKGKKSRKQIVTPDMLGALIEWIAELHATMVYVAIFTGLRITELVALKWNDLRGDAPLERFISKLGAARQKGIAQELEPCSVTIDETFCRGEWNAPKSESSNAAIAINPCVIRTNSKVDSNDSRGEKAGHAVRKITVVRKDGLGDLVSQG